MNMRKAGLYILIFLVLNNCNSVNEGIASADIAQAPHRKDCLACKAPASRALLLNKTAAVAGE